MPKNYHKYNWKALKIKYLNSSEPYVQNFLKEELLQVNGHVLKMTTGWYREKVKYEEEKAQNKLEQFQLRKVDKETNKIIRPYRKKLLKQAWKRFNKEPGLVKSILEGV